MNYMPIPDLAIRSDCCRARLTRYIATDPLRMMPLKNFVLDTNVLLHDPKAIFGFEDNVVCPFALPRSASRTLRRSRPILRTCNTPSIRRPLPRPS